MNSETNITTYLGGTRAWFQKDQLHRLDGPAIVYHDGSMKWYIRGRAFHDVWAWAKMAVQHENREPTLEMIEQKVQQALAKNILE